MGQNNAQARERESERERERGEGAEFEKKTAGQPTGFLCL